MKPLRPGKGYKGDFLLWLRRRKEIYLASALLAGENDGLAIDFTDKSMQIKDSTTAANNYNARGNISGDGTLTGPDGKLTYTSPSPKMCLQSTGLFGWTPHNLCKETHIVASSMWWNKVTGATVTGADSYSDTGVLVTIPAQFANLVAVTQNQEILGQRYRFSCDIMVVSGNTSLTGVAGGLNSIALSAALVTGTWVSVYYDYTAVDGGGGFDSAGIQDRNASNLGSFRIRYPRICRTPSAHTPIANTTAATIYSLPYEYSTAGVSQGVLEEEARTNLALQSNTFGTTWTALNLTNLTNTTTGPDGVAGSMTLLNETTTAAGHAVNQNVTKAASALPYVLSVFAKVGVGRTRITLYLNDGGGNGAICPFDLSGGQAGTPAGFGVAFTSLSAQIISLGNGVYRCILIGTTNTTTTVNAYVANDNGSGTAASSFSYAGTVGNGCYIYQAQLEQASTISSPLGGSPIFTTTASVTRAVDNFNEAVSTFPYSTTVGTLYSKFIAPNPNGLIVILSDGTAGNDIQLYDNVGNFGLQVDASSSLQAQINKTGTATAAHKIAGSWAVNDFKCSLDAGAVGTDVSGSIPSGITTLGLGSRGGTSSMNGYLQQVLYLPRAMSGAELQSKTT